MVLVVTCNCGFTENRRNQRKSTPKGGGNSPKSGDDRVGQVFVCVTAGSNRFERVAALPFSRSGRSEKRLSVIHDSASFAYFFFQIFSSHDADSPFQMRVTFEIFWSWRHICGFAGKIERIEGNRPLRVGKIRRNPARIALAKFFPTSSRVRTGFNGLPCSGSGRSERRPSIIHEDSFFGYFFIFLAPTVRLPLFKRCAHAHTHTEKWTHL